MISSVSRASRVPTILRPVRLGHSVSLDDGAADPADDLPDRGEMKKRIEKQQERITEIQNRLYGEGKQALLVILQGRDTCGKDSTIRRVFGAVNPEGSEVTSFKTPTELELRHDFLWRIHQRVPPHGIIGVFNRSHYEDVLIVRVRELVPAAVWRKRFDLINDFERMLSENRVTILKFFLHISREEQATRLRERLEDPEKNWKFRAGDLAERSRWDEYTTAYVDMLRKCSTPWAPWYVVPANKKLGRDYLISDVVLRTLQSMRPRLPQADKDVLAYRGKI
ncbi:MAG: polyphosphate kinase 2 family protein [Anaerolineae bacterium]|nr:polyphosphate kinase 2 family protein [Gemmatimonadaceae bacterium]